MHPLTHSPLSLYSPYVRRMYDLEKISTDAHPRAFTPLDDSEIHFAIPLPLPCSAEHLSNTSAFLLDGGSHLLLQVGKDAPPDLLDEVLAQSHADPTKPQELSEGSDLGGKGRSSHWTSALKAAVCPFFLAVVSHLARRFVPSSSLLRHPPPHCSATLLITPPSPPHTSQWRAC